MAPFDLKLFEALPEALLVVRSEHVLWANAAAQRMLGGAVVGLRLDALLAPGELERLQLLDAQRKRGWDLPGTCRVRFARIDGGAEITTDLRIGQADEDRILSARDVTDVTRAEDLMGKLAQIFERGGAIPDAEALLDASEPVFDALGWKVAFTEIFADGSNTRRIIGASAGDPAGDYIRSLLDARMPYGETAVLAEVLKTGRPLFVENLPEFSTGPVAAEKVRDTSMPKAHVLRSAWCPVLTEGKISHVVAVTGRGLTEHDFVAVQLFAAQIGAAIHMQMLRTELIQHERLAAIGEMAAVMAHEVRNPLGVIFNALSRLRKPDGGSSATAELLAIMHEEAERLRRLVTDLIDFSRPSAVEPRNVPLGPLMHQAVEAARLDPTCESSKAEIAIDIAPEETCIETDPLLLRRALVNLLVNAMQYVPPGGTIGLTARLEGKELHVRVENEGPTMPPEVAARVFEPFFTTRASGTGLGLAVVRRIVEDLGGRIELDPSSERTAFSLYVPAECDPSLV